MEYNVEDIRLLAEKYFRGETTLAEEAALREYFNGGNEIPADLEACRLLFGQSAEAAAGKPRRELRLHTEPVAGRSLRRWVAAVSGVAAAALVTVFVTMDFNRSQAGDIVCYVNGHLITDRQAAMEYTQKAIGIINDNLQKPAEYISAKTESRSTMERVSGMLDQLTEQTDNQ